MYFYTKKYPMESLCDRRWRLMITQAAQAQNVRSFFFFFHFDANAQYGIYYITTNSTTRKRDVSIWRCCLQRFEFIKVCMGSQRLF